MPCWALGGELWVRTLSRASRSGRRQGPQGMADPCLLAGQRSWQGAAAAGPLRARSQGTRACPAERLRPRPQGFGPRGNRSAQQRQLPRLPGAPVYDLRARSGSAGLVHLARMTCLASQCPLISPRAAGVPTSTGQGSAPSAKALAATSDKTCAGARALAGVFSGDANYTNCSLRSALRLARGCAKRSPHKGSGRAKHGLREAD